MRFVPLALLFGLAVSAAAQTEGVGFRLTPSATYVDFEGDAVLEDGLLYGGGVGLSFGEFVELGGVYLRGRNFETDYTQFSGLDENRSLAERFADLPVQEVDLERYGAELRLNLGTGSFFPFLRAGTGLVRFDPEGREATRNIYLLGGAGLQLSGADRYALSVSAENFAYRYNPGTTFFSEADLDAVGLSQDNFNQTTVQNLAVRASLSLYLGGRRPGSLTDVDREFQRQFAGGLGGVSLVVEPFYGRVDFDDAFAYRDQTFVGGEAGFDLGPLVGLRGFYGRGTPSDDPTDFQDIQMVGGDVRLRLSEGSGLVPFLTVGGGYLDVLDGYATDDGAEPQNADAEDRPFALAGGGVELFLGRRLRAVGEVRGLVMSTEDEDDLSQPENVYVSPFFRGGLAFALGGDTGDDIAVVRRERFEAELAAARAEAAEREAELREEIARARAEGDSLAVIRLEAERQRAEAVALSDDPSVVLGEAALRDEVAEMEAEMAEMDETETLITEIEDDEIVEGEIEVAEVEDREVEVLAPAGTPAARAGRGGVVRQRAAPPAARAGEVRTAEGDRIVTIPLPEEGELYVRYGDPGGVQIETTDGFAPSPGVAQGTAQTVAPGATEAEIRASIREAIRQSLDANGQALDADDIERRLEDRLADRIDAIDDDRETLSATEIAVLLREMEDRIIDEIRALRAEVAGRSVTVIDGDAPARLDDDVDDEVVVDLEDDVEEVGPGGVVVARPEVVAPVETVVVRERSLALAPTVGLQFGDAAGALVGVQASYSRGPTIRYVPELLVGVAGDDVFVLNADVAFDVGGDRVRRFGTPYVRTGIGFVNESSDEDDPPPTFDEEDGGSSLTFNLGVGGTLRAGGGRFFVDFSSGNFGAFNRLTGGYRVTFGR